MIDLITVLLGIVLLGSKRNPEKSYTIDPLFLNAVKEP